MMREVRRGSYSIKCTDNTFFIMREKERRKLIILLNFNICQIVEMNEFIK